MAEWFVVYDDFEGNEQRIPRMDQGSAERLAASMQTPDSLLTGTNIRVEHAEAIARPLTLEDVAQIMALPRIKYPTGSIMKRESDGRLFEVTTAKIITSLRGEPEAQYTLTPLDKKGATFTIPPLQLSQYFELSKQPALSLPERDIPKVQITRVGIIRDYQDRKDLVFVIVRAEVELVKKHLGSGVDIERFEGFLARFDNGELAEVYGFECSVPMAHESIWRIDVLP